MAQIVSTQRIVCPRCGAVGIVRIWSCGCQDVNHTRHEKRCNYSGDAFFIELKQECGEFGEVKKH